MIHANTEQNWKAYLNRHAHEKGPCGFPICGSSNAHAQSPISVTDMRFGLKLTHGIFYMSTNSNGFGETAPMRRLN